MASAVTSVSPSAGSAASSSTPNQRASHGRAADVDHRRRHRAVDRDPVEGPHAVPVDRVALRAERGRVAVAGHAEQLDQAAVLPGLLDQLADQRGAGLLAVVGAAAGQVPAAGARVARRRPGSAAPGRAGSVATAYAAKRCARCRPSGPGHGVERRELRQPVGAQVDRAGRQAERGGGERAQRQRRRPRPRCSQRARSVGWPTRSRSVPPRTRHLVDQPVGVDRDAPVRQRPHVGEHVAQPGHGDRQAGLGGGLAHDGVVAGPRRGRPRRRAATRRPACRPWPTRAPAGTGRRRRCRSA